MYVNMHAELYYCKYIQLHIFLPADSGQDSYIKKITKATSGEFNTNSSYSC